MTARTDIFRADLSGTAFGGTPTWTDLSAYLLAEGQGEPVSITWGRQDEESDVTPSVMTVVLDNADGRFTPDRTASPYYPRMTTGFRANFRQTVNATTYDRFDGYCTEIAQAFPGSSEGWSVVRLTFVDVTAKLAEAQPLRSLLLQEMLADSPTYLYPLGEAAGSTSAASIVGTSSPLVAGVAQGSGIGVVMGADTGLFDPATGADFSQNTDAPATGAVGPVAFMLIPTGIPATSAFSIEQWIVTPTAIPVNGQYTYDEERPVTGSGPALIEIAVGSLGQISAGLRDASQTVTVAGSANICNGQLYQVVVVLDSDRKTLRLYLNGAQVASGVAASVFSFPTTGGTIVLGALNDGTYDNPFTGIIANHTLYPSALSATRVLLHYQAGVGTGPAEQSDARFARIAAYGGITTSGLPSGIATMGGQTTAGKTALDALKAVARTEGTVCFVTGAGALTFQGRGQRYHETAAVTLNTANHDVDPGFSPRKDDQGLINDITVSRAAGADQRVQDAASISANGRSDPGGYTVSSSTDDDAYQAANWQVATHKNPSLRVPSLMVDLLTQPTTVTTQAVLGVGVSSKIALTGLPSIAPATSMNLFVEGGKETIGLRTWEIEFFTSPITIEDSVLVLDDATFGLLDSGLVGF